MRFVAPGRHLVTSLVLLPIASFLSGCTERAMPTDDHGLSCIFDFRVNETVCRGVPARSRVQDPPLSRTKELVLRAVSASRVDATLLLDIELEGRFRNAADQNIYVFIGASGHGSTRYALTADPKYFDDLSYPVRGAVEFPHGNDVRVGIMAPEPSNYTPQVYATDLVKADLVGIDAGIVQTTRADGTLHFEIPLDRYYALKKQSIPERIAATVATARDYVGFVDQITTREIGSGEACRVTERPAPPMAYPDLDLGSHHFEAIKLVKRDGLFRVEIDTAAPIRDWGQTNAHVFFFPAPPFRSASPLADPSGQLRFPYKWSYYCGVYSPTRIFCKTSGGHDFTFDRAYAERDKLEAADGVRFRQEDGRKIVLELPADLERTWRAKQATFAVGVLLGRDGSGPTSWYGMADDAGPR